MTIRTKDFTVFLIKDKVRSSFFVLKTLIITSQHSLFHPYCRNNTVYSKQRGWEGVHDRESIWGSWF